MEIPSLEQRIGAIETRNAKVAIDKAWETSLTRRAIISLITYGVAGLLLVILGSAAPWLYALVPVIGYILSTLTLPFIRHIWQRECYEKRK